MVAITVSVTREDGRQSVKVNNPSEDICTSIMMASPHETSSTVSASSALASGSVALSPPSPPSSSFSPASCALCEAAPAGITDVEDLGKVMCANSADCPRMQTSPRMGSRLFKDPVLKSIADADVPHVCDGLPFTKYMLAGAIAGMVEHVAMFPVDTIKTRMQADPALINRGTGNFNHYTSVPSAVRQIMRTEGPRGMYRGVSAMALGAGPAHAVYFAAYEKAKQILMGPGKTTVDPAVAAVSGALATVAADGVMLPMDVVKQRLQLPGSTHKGVWDCMSQIAKEEGLRPFFRSYRTTVLMNVPYTVVHFSVYEKAKQFLGHAHGLGADADLDHLEESISTHLLAGGSAGALAAAVTNPLDVVKTRQQTECVKTCAKKLEHANNVYRCLTHIGAKEGYAALLKGIGPRVMFHTPAAAICWTTYESLKSYLA